MIKLNSNMKFKDFINYYNEDIAKLRWSITTIEKSKSIINNRIIPYLGNVRLGDLDSNILKQFLISQIHSKPALKSQISNNIKISYYKRIRAILSSIINSAVDLNLIEENNLKRVRINITNYEENTMNSLCLQNNSKMRYYNKNTYLKVLRLLKKAPLSKRLIVEIALKGGLRKSEIFGLTWNDIDFKSKTITIDKSRQYIKGIGMVLKSTKNISSNRKIIVGESLIHLLKKYCDNYFHGNNEFLFNEISFTGISEWFRRWQKQNGINPVIRFHDLRHTHASLLLLQGVDFKTISSRLGHSSIVTTMNIYTHVIESLDREAALKIEKLENHKRN